MYVDIVRSVLIDSFSLVHVISYAAISNQVLIVTSLILALFDMAVGKVVSNMSL